MYFFTVLTYPGGITDELQQRCCTYCAEKFTSYIIVKEYGKSKKNPHLNVVYLLPEYQNEVNWSKNASKMWKLLYQGMFLPDKTPNLTRTKKCSTPENVIGGYLQKESICEILVNTGFDILKMKQQALSNQKDKDKEKPVQIHKAHIVIYEYLENTKKDYDMFLLHGNYSTTYQEIYSVFKQAIMDMIKEGYIIAHLLPKLKLIYDTFRIVYFDDSSILDKYIRDS